MANIINCEYCGKPRPETVSACPYCKPTTKQVLQNGIDKTAETVSRTASNINAAMPQKPHEPAPQKQNNQVIITGVDIPIGDMVTFMIKWAIACIPAAIILTIIVAGVTALLSVLGHAVK